MPFKVSWPDPGDVDGPDLSHPLFTGSGIATLQAVHVIHIQISMVMKLYRAAFFAFGGNSLCLSLLCCCYAGFVFATNIRAAEPTEPAQTTQPEPAKAPQPLQIPFNKQNKETAKRIYQLMREIQESEFRPETNLGAITKLQETVSQTDFSTLAAAADYIRDSLTLNTLRSKDIKTQQANTGKNANQNESQSGISGGINPTAISFWRGSQAIRHAEARGGNLQRSLDLLSKRRRSARQVTPATGHLLRPVSQRTKARGLSSSCRCEGAVGKMEVALQRGCGHL